jgi:hypothetical protein
MSPAAVTAPLRIRGTPRHLSALLPGPGTPSAATVKLSLAGATQEAAALAVASFPAFVNGIGELRLELPRSTPPGIYEGAVRIGDREQLITVEVEAAIRLRLFPKSLQVTGSPGEKIAADLTIVNDGNAPADIRTGYAFWLFREDGVDRALGSFLKMGVKPKVSREERLEHLFDAVDQQYGGQVRVKVGDGAGQVAAGSSRELHVQFVLPAGLQPGQVYDGMWPLHNLHWPLRVKVTGAPQQEETTP